MEFSLRNTGRILIFVLLNQKNKIMKVVSQVIPTEQKQILIDCLNLMETALKTVNTDDDNLVFKLFDIVTLKAMLNKTELVVNVPFDVYEKFTSINGVDYPNYINTK